MKRHVYFPTILLCLLVGCDTIGPLRYAGLQAELDKNRAIWAEAGIDSYEYRYNNRCFCDLTAVRVHVEGGVVTAAFYGEEGTPLTDLSGYPTIDMLFDYIQRGIHWNYNAIQVEFDSGRGFPTSFYRDLTPTLPLIGISDDESTTTVNDFTPL